MAGLAPHKIKLGNLTASAEVYGFEYRCKHGVDPGGATITFPLTGNQQDDRALIREVNALLGKPTTLEIEIDQFPGGKQRLVIRNLYPHDPKIQESGGTYAYSVSVSDLRWKWTGFPVDGHFNLVRRLNDLQVTENGELPSVPGQARIVNGDPVTPTVLAGVAPIEPEIDTEGRIVNFRPKDVLSKHATYPASAYRFSTLDWNNGDFTAAVSAPAQGEGTSVAVGQAPAGTRPWTALRMIQAILRGYSAFGTKGMVRVPGALQASEWGGFRDGLEDNGFLVARESFQATNIQQVLPKLLRLAECRLVVWIDGKVYLHPTYSETPPELPDEARYEGGGVLYMSNNQADRPSSVFVRFENELTREFTYLEIGSGIAKRGLSGDGKKANNRSIEPKLTNVIQLPTNETLDLGDGPREYQRGEWHPIEPVLRAWNMRGPDYIRSRIYKFFEGAVAAEIYGQSAAVQPGVDEAVQRRIAAVKQAYRRTFRVDPDYLDVMLDLKAESAILLDRISGRRQLAPVWVDYSMQRRLRIEEATVKSAILRFADVVYEKAGDGASPADDEPPSPFLISVVDPALGIIRYDPIDEMGVQEIYPWIVEDDDGREFDVGRNINNSNLTNASPAGDYAFATHLTVKECDPNSAQQYTTIEIPNASIGAQPGLHPPYYVFDASETARYDINGNMVNEVMCKARAQSIARSIQGTFQDRLVGVAGWAGLHEIYPKANARFVSWRLDPDGMISTTLDMSEPPPRRDEDVVLGDPRLRLTRQRLPEAP